MIPIAYNLRNLAARKTTTIAAAGGLALVVFVFSSVMMASNGIRKTMGRSGREDTAIVIRKGSENELSSGIEESQVGLVLATAGVKKNANGQPLGVGEVVVVPIMEKVGGEGMSNVQIRGVPENVMEFRPEVKLVEGRLPKPGADEVIVGKAIQGRFVGLSLRQSFELKKNRSATVVGVFEAGGSSFESEIWADIYAVRSAYGRENTVSGIRMQLESAAKFDSVKLAIENNRQLGLEVIRESSYYEKQSEGTSLFIQALGILIAVFFSFAAMIGAMITMHASIASRQKEIGTLRALGFSKFSILMAFLFESIVLALIGGVVGVIASLGWTFVKVSIMNFATWSEVVFTFEPTASILLISVVVTVVMGLIGGLLPAIRAARLNPVVAMRG